MALVWGVVIVARYHTGLETETSADLEYIGGYVKLAPDGLTI
jgi:hypothetical protein